MPPFSKSTIENDAAEAAFCVTIIENDAASLRYRYMQKKWCAGVTGDEFFVGWRGCESGGRVSIFMARLAVVIAVRDSEKGAGHRTIFLNGTVVQYQYVPFSLECGTAKRARDIAQFFFYGTVVLVRTFFS